jgi:ribosomal protein S18 acetylase RimI-like enzyme
MFPQLPPLRFPPARASVDASAAMRARELGVRAAVEADLPYLRTLYRALRQDELLAHTNWPDEFKLAFLDNQFAMQHVHYLNVFAAADFWIVEQQGQPIGRYYLLRQPPNYHVVELSLESAWRGRGVGGLLLDWTQSLVREQQARGIDLQVDEANLAAQRLYQRTGFTEIGRQSPSIAMHWTNPLHGTTQLNTAW